MLSRAHQAIGLAFTAHHHDQPRAVPLSWPASPVWPAQLDHKTAATSRLLLELHRMGWHVERRRLPDHAPESVAMIAPATLQSLSHVGQASAPRGALCTAQ